MLRIIIVGAGIAGLAAAVSLRRAGHLVHVYERSAMNNEVGAAINVPPNTTRFLTAWGLDPAQWHFVPARRTTIIDPFTLETTDVVSDGNTARSMGGANPYYAHRVDLHNALKWMATRADGPGAPATIHLQAPATTFNPEAASVTLDSGEVISGDVVIGADGVHSKALEAVLGRPVVPRPPEHANTAFRFLIPATVLEEDPETRFWSEDRDGWMRILLHNETRRKLVCYPCRNNEVLNFVGIVDDEKMKYETREDWLARVDVSDVVETFADFSPKLLKVIRKATEVTRWPLLYRHPVPTWCKGQMALTGDAAHPMLPNQGQGAAMALEDGLAMGLILHGSSSAPEEIQRRLAVYEKLRRNRASAIQILSNVAGGQAEIVRQELLPFMEPEKIPTKPSEFFRYNLGYDIVRDTMKAMKQYDPGFELPDGFFEGEVIGVPGDAPLEVPWKQYQGRL